MLGCWSLRHMRASRSSFWKSLADSFFVLMIFEANFKEGEKGEVTPTQIRQKGPSTCNPVALCTHLRTTEKAPLPSSSLIS